jgi:hypothetical protein
MFSRSLGKISGVVLFCLAVGTTASAQYGGGTGGTGMGTGTGTGMGATGTPNYSYGNGKAIGVGVGAAAGAAVGIALYIHHRHVKAREEAQALQTQTPSPEASIIGCTQSMLSGVTLKNENDSLSYTVVSNGSAKLQPGQRVELQGAVLSDKSGVNAFSVHRLVGNYGACGSSTALAQKTGKDTSTFAANLN